jgi:hypothetical protein
MSQGAFPDVKEYSTCCQGNYKDLIESTSPDPRAALRIRRLWWAAKKYVWYASILGPTKLVSAIRKTTNSVSGQTSATLGALPPTKEVRSSRLVEAQSLKPGDWVRVRSAGEIFATLDANGRHRGLGIVPEMTKFCGKQYRVFKNVNQICIETTGEIRRIKTPTVLLEGGICDGSFHGGCDRSLFIFWREAWLEKVPGPGPKQLASSPQV